MDVAIEAERAKASSKPLSIVTEYPAHLPAVQGERDSVAGAIGAMIRTVSAFTDRGEIRVRAELLPSGEVPATFSEVAGNPEGVGAGGPWAVVSVQAALGRIPADTMQALYAGKSLRAVGAEPVSLAPVQSAAQAWGGQTWMESQPAGGARISLALPLRAGSGRADGVRDRSRASAWRRQFQEHVVGRSGRCGCWDDDHCATVLAPRGAEVGQQAIEQIPD
jgi:hypothetical protein